MAAIAKKLSECWLKLKLPPVPWGMSFESFYPGISFVRLGQCNRLAVVGIGGNLAPYR